MRISLPPPRLPGDPAVDALAPSTRAPDDVFEAPREARPATAVDAAAIAANADSLPEELKRAAMQSKDPQVLARLAAHPNSPDEVVLALWREAAALSHPRVVAGSELAARLTARLARDGSDDDVMRVAHHPATPPEVLIFLAATRPGACTRLWLWYRHQPLPLAALAWLVERSPGQRGLRVDPAPHFRKRFLLSRPVVDDVSRWHEAILKTLGVAALPETPSVDATFQIAGNPFPEARRALIETVLATHRAISDPLPNTEAERAAAAAVSRIVVARGPLALLPDEPHQAFTTTREQLGGAQRQITDALAHLEGLRALTARVDVLTHEKHLLFIGTHAAPHPAVRTAVDVLAQFAELETLRHPDGNTVAALTAAVDAATADVASALAKFRPSGYAASLQRLIRAARHGALPTADITAVLALAQGKPECHAVHAVLREIFDAAAGAVRRHLAERRVDAFDMQELKDGARLLGTLGAQETAASLERVLQLARDIDAQHVALSTGADHWERTKAVFGRADAAPAAELIAALFLDSPDGGRPRRERFDHPSLARLSLEERAFAARWLARHTYYPSIAAQHPETPPGELVSLARHESYEIRGCVAGNRSTPEAALTELVDRNDTRFDTAVPYLLANPRLAIDGALAARLTARIYGKDASRHGMLAQHPNTPTQILEHLAANGTPDTAASAAAHPRCSDLALRVALLRLDGAAQGTVARRILARQNGDEAVPEPSPFGAVVAALLGPPPANPPDAAVQRAMRFALRGVEFARYDAAVRELAERTRWARADLDGWLFAQRDIDEATIARIEKEIVDATDLVKRFDGAADGDMTPQEVVDRTAVVLASAARLRAAMTFDNEAEALRKYGFVCRGFAEIRTVVANDAVVRWEVRFENTGDVPWAGTMAFAASQKRAGFGFESMGVPEKNASALQPIFAAQNYGVAPGAGEVLRLGVRGYASLDVPLPAAGTVRIPLKKFVLNGPNDDSKPRYFALDYVLNRRDEKAATNRVAFIDGAGKQINRPFWLGAT